MLGSVTASQQRLRHGTLRLPQKLTSPARTQCWWGDVAEKIYIAITRINILRYLKLQSPRFYTRMAFCTLSKINSFKH